MKLTNPTGMPARGSDRYGAGHFGASRDGGVRTHAGLDLQASPWQTIVSPLDGIFVRHKRPYGDGKDWDDGMLLAGSGGYAGLEITLFYVLPTIPPGVTIKAGDRIGFALLIDEKYPGITLHVHLGAKLNGEWIDPTPLLFQPPQNITA